LSLSADQKLFLDNKPVELANLKEALEEMLAATPNRSLALNADKAAPFGFVVSVMDVLKEANVRNVPAFTQHAEQ
jgi:biopolymer transport protein ExbD